MGLSNLGIFHTIIGIIAIITALTAFLRNGKIDLNRFTGKLYFYTTLISSLTALGISKSGGFNPGHVFALFIVLLVAAAFYLSRKKQANKRARYFENFLLSFSFLLSLVPTINETFTRIPIGRPLASSPADPVIAKTLLALLLLFAAGSIYQFRKQRKINRAA